MKAPNRGARLTSHQAEVFARLDKRSEIAWDEEGAAVLYRWVRETEVGSHSALWHLVRKGRIEVRQTRGPRGGTHYEYRPLHEIGQEVKA